MIKDNLENMVKNITEEKKKRVIRDKEIELNKIDFLYEVFNENKVVLNNYLDEKKISVLDGYNHLCNIVDTLPLNIHLEGKEEGKLVQVKDAEKSLYVQSGYYKINSDKKLDSEMSFEQISLIPTEKGKNISEKYKKILSA